MAKCAAQPQDVTEVIANEDQTEILVEDQTLVLGEEDKTEIIKED